MTDHEISITIHADSVEELHEKMQKILNGRNISTESLLREYQRSQGK